MSELNLNLKQRNVLKIINKYPAAANNDALLLARYWEEIDHWQPWLALYNNLQNVTRPETITRRRRELYNLGLIKYTNDAEKARTEAYNNEHERHEAVSWL